MILPKYIELTVYLEGGVSITVKCKKYKFSLNSTNTAFESYFVEGIKDRVAFSVLPNKIIAFKAKLKFGF